MLKLSIILPIYNVQLYLKKCLESIKPLLTQNVELIIVNDGSNDDSLNIAQNFISNTETNSVKLIDQDNKGLSSARNSGLEIATGDYIWFIDSDDYIIPQKACELIHHLETEVADIILFGRITKFASKTTYFLPYSDVKKSGIEYFNAAVSNLKYRTNVWDKVYRRKFIQKMNLKFIEGLSYEDMLFNLVAFINADRISVLPEYVYVYNCKNSSSITSIYREKDLDVLTFAKLAQDYASGNNHFLSFKTSYYIHMFTWINSCLINKYSSVFKTNSMRHKILEATLTNLCFVKSAKYCAKNNRGIPLRVKILSKIFIFNTHLYYRIVALALTIKQLL